MGERVKAQAAITKARWLLESALYHIRVHRLRDLHAQMLARQIPQDVYAKEAAAFWQRHERTDDE